MKIYTYEMSDKSKTYNFYLTNAAKREIEERQGKNMKELANSEMIEDMISAESLKSELDKAETDEEKEAINKKINKLTLKMLPYIDQVQNMETLDIEELPFILLKNHKDNREINELEYEELMNDMEDTLGFEEYNNKLIEIAEKVFTLIEKVNDHKKTALSKNKNKTQMMS